MKLKNSSSSNIKKIPNQQNYAMLEINIFENITDFISLIFLAITTTELASASGQGTLNVLSYLQQVLLALNSVSPSASLDEAISTVDQAQNSMLPTTTTKGKEN